MNVLIVARTKMHSSHCCIGGLAADGRSVRLLTAAGHHGDTSSPFQVGQIWNIDFQPAQNLVAPHVEDVLVSRQVFVETQSNMRNHLLSSVARWQGGIDQLFGGLLGYTLNNNGYVSQGRGVPPQSTGFWIPDRDLTLRDDGKHYDYSHGLVTRGLAYVGEVNPLPVVPAGTLVRVSLARWWRPDGVVDLEERCYGQLSGWYL